MKQEIIKIKIVLIFCFIICSQFSFAQSNDSTYLNVIKKKHLNPTSTISTGLTKDILKIDIIQLFDGGFQPIWEHRFNDDFGFDIGVGLLMQYSLNKKIGFDSNSFADDKFIYNIGKLFFYYNDTFDNQKLGYSFQFEPKYYFLTKPKFISLYHSNSIGPFYRFRSYSNLLINEIGLEYTYYPKLVKILFAPTIALSYTIQTPFNNVSELKYFGKQTQNLNSHGLPDYTSLRLCFRLNIGYIFN